MANMEVRNFDAEISIEGNTLVGRAANYNVESHLVVDETGRYIEVLDPGCFDRSLGGDRLSGLEDITCHYDHDTPELLGRTSSGTLRVWSDDRGLAFEVDLPDTTTGRNVKALVERGDLKGCSFGMIIRDRWQDIPSSLPVRHVVDADLIEVSIVVRPQYPDTSVALRSLEQSKAEMERLAEVEASRKRLEESKAELDSTIRRLDDFVRTTTCH